MKRKRIIFSVGVSLFLGATLMSACKNSTRPSAVIATKSYWIDNLKGILVSDKIIIHYTNQEETDSIKISGPQNMVDNLEIEKSLYGILNISLKRGDRFDCKSEDEYVKIWISQPNVSTFTAMKNAQIYSYNLFYRKKVYSEVYSSAIIHFSALKANSIEFNAYTNGKIFCNELSAKNLDINAFTESEIVVSGKSEEVNITANSAFVDSKGLITGDSFN